MVQFRKPSNFEVLIIDDGVIIGIIDVREHINDKYGSVALIDLIEQAKNKAKPIKEEIDKLTAQYMQKYNSRTNDKMWLGSSEYAEYIKIIRNNPRLAAYDRYYFGNHTNTLLRSISNRGYKYVSDVFNNNATTKKQLKAAINLIIFVYEDEIVAALANDE